jgi:hypothetical protein
MSLRPPRLAYGRLFAPADTTAREALNIYVPAAHTEAQKACPAASAAEYVPKAGTVP